MYENYTSVEAYFDNFCIHGKQKQTTGCLNPQKFKEICQILLKKPTHCDFFNISKESYLCYWSFHNEFV